MNITTYIFTVTTQIKTKVFRGHRKDVTCCDFVTDDVILRLVSHRISYDCEYINIQMNREGTLEPYRL